MTRTRKNKKGGTFGSRSTQGSSYTQNYKPFTDIVDNDDELVQFSRALGTLFMIKESRDSINFWRRKRVVHQIPKNCISSVIPQSFIDDRFIIYEELETVIPMVNKFFNKHGLHTKDILDLRYDINIEVHYANADKDTKIGSNLDIHSDNDGALRGKLHTCIVYLDIDCDGGELEIYDDQGSICTGIVNPRSGDDGEILPYNSKKNKINGIIEGMNKNKTKIVTFDGSMYHRPREMTNGKRLIVTYQFRQRRPPRGGSKSKQKNQTCKEFKKEAEEYEPDVESYSRTAA